MMKFGSAKYGDKQEFKKKVYFKLKDGDQVFRILPPMGDLAEKGVWSRFYSVHFGYKNTEGKLRTFVSPLVRNNKTKMIEVPDAALDRINDLKAKLEEAKASGNAPMVAKLNTLVGFKGVYSADNNHHMNVMDLNGTIGVLKIRHRAKLALDAEIKKLRSEGCDPLSVEDGRFFVFNRNGMSLDTAFKVTVHKERIDVPGVGRVERDVISKLTPEMLQRCSTEASHLDKLFNSLTSEEVAEVVAQSDMLSGKSPAIDKYFDQRWKAKRNQETIENKFIDAAVAAHEDDEFPSDDYVSPVALAPVAVAQTVVAKETKTALSAPVVVKTQTQGQQISELSDADFFAALGT